MPILWFLIATSSVVFYEKNWEGGNKFWFDGPGLSLDLSIIVATVLVIRIFRRVEDILISKRIIKSRVATPYDVFPILLIIPFGIGGQWFGEKLQSATAMNGTIYQWVFKWGLGEHKFLSYLSILGLILLYRIHQLLLAIIQEEAKKD